MKRAQGAGWLIVLAVLLVLGGCRNLFEPERHKAAEEYGAFTLEVSGLRVGRTILPATAQGDFSVYALVFSSEGKDDVSVDLTNEDLGNTIPLAVGTWNLNVTAYMDGGKTKPVARGSVTGIAITAGSTANRSVELFAIIETGASGAFLWNIDYPNDVTSARMTITPIDPETGTAEQILYFTGGMPLVDKDNSASPLILNAGYYRVVFSLSNGERSTGREEYLHIYQNMESRFEYAFSQDHFTVYSVTKEADNGPGSLRHAVTNAAGGSTILIEADVEVIELVERLVINKSLAIEGNGTVITRGALWDSGDSLVFISGSDTEVTVRRVHFKDGMSADNGAAVYNSGASVALESCIFSGNRTDISGGAIYNAGTMDVKGCTFYGNIAEDRGGAAYNAGGGSLSLTGNLFWGNAAKIAANGPAVYRINGTVSSGGYNVSDAVLVANPQNGWVPATGDATFEDLGIISTPVDENFSLLPCLCARVPALPDFPATDFFGNARTFPGAPGGSVTAADAHTVTFNANEATSGTAIAAQEVISGYAIMLPGVGSLKRSGYSFGGWNKQSDGNGTNYISSHFEPDDDIILYAKWNPVFEALGSTLAAKLQWLQENAQDGFSYTVTVNAGESIAPASLYYGGNSISITITSGTECIITLLSNGSLFAVGGGVTLTLDGNITLQGHNSNTASLVQVNDGGILITNDGSRIIGNATTAYGGGVNVAGGGTFDMNGGEISGNTASDGGGVYVGSGGSFTMYDGTISGNTATSNGGGVHVGSGGTFAMDDGTISVNTAASNGGGVHVIGGFTLFNGIISGNNAVYGGGINTIGTFVMDSGTISGNTSVSDGGGINITGGTLTVYNGEITGNESGTNGGGIAMLSGVLAIHNADISGNSAVSGGGIYTLNGTVRLTGATITDNTAGGASLFKGVSATAQYGKFTGSVWHSNGILDTTDETICVQDGLLAYTLTFNANGADGTIPPHAGSNIVLPGSSGLTRPGYTFNGWNTNAGGTGKDYQAGAVYNFSVIGNVALYAQWTVHTLTINYANGGGTGVAPTNPTTANYGTSVTMPPNTYTRIGYTFAGWAVSGTGSIESTHAAGVNVAVTNLSSIIVNGNASITLTAIWTPINYTVTYNANNATGGTVPTDSVNYNISNTVTVLGNTGSLARTGYTFAGWNTASNGSGTSYTNGATFTMGSANVILYAQWTPVNYTVTYNANNATGGTVPTDSTNYNIGNTVTVLGNTGSLARTGYTFAGWNTASNGTGTSYNIGATFSMGSANVILYAQWTLTNYTVTYNANSATGGTVPTDLTNYTIGQTVKVLGNTGNLIRTGYLFAGWNTVSNGTGTSYTAGSTFSMGSENIVLYARWVEGIISSSGIEMVQLNAGTFIRSGNTVTLSGFKMGKYEVTQVQYQAVMGTNPSRFGSNPANGEVQARRPVEQVSWYDAVEFCNALSVLEGLAPAYTINKTAQDPNNTNSYDTIKWTVTLNGSASGYRLPTEAEWEYACRAGTATNWHFGDTQSDLVNYAWYYNNSESKTHEAEKKLPNGWGLYDMHGNVWEWCWDWYGSYPSGNQEDPKGATTGAYRVIRGGSWYFSADGAQSGYRNSLSPYSRISYYGFRLVRP